MNLSKSDLWYWFATIAYTVAAIVNIFFFPFTELYFIQLVWIFLLIAPWVVSPISKWLDVTPVFRPRR